MNFRPYECEANIIPLSYCPKSSLFFFLNEKQNKTKLFLCVYLSMCDIRHEHDMACMQRLEDKLAFWLLPSTCVSQGLLFTAVYGRTAGLMIFQKFSLSASHLTIEVHEFQMVSWLYEGSGNQNSGLQTCKVFFIS